MANRDSILHFCERESSLDLEPAIAQARTQWLQQWLKHHLPEIAHLRDTPEDHQKARQWDAHAKDMMAERGLVSSAQQKNRLTDIRNALKTLNPDHPALQDVGFSAEEWEAINRSSEKKLSDRTTKLLSNPDALVDQAILLLDSHDWYDIAAGLAVLTGRRCAEILKTATFEYKSPYSVTFTGAVKRRDEPLPLSFEIPTLAPAPTIIEATAKLREWVDTQGLDNRAINNKYAQAVIKSCDRHFKNLVPTRDGEDNLYTHLFRAVYATIASHWYCPPTLPELEFRAYIQGHFKILDEQNPELRRSLAAQRNYFDYKIADGEENIDGRLGIKLDSVDAPFLAAFESYYQPHCDEKDEKEDTTPSLTEESRVDHQRVVNDLLKMLSSSNPMVLLTGLIGLTGRSPAELLKSGTFHSYPFDNLTLLFSPTGVVSPSPLPVGVDGAILLDAIASLRQHRDVQKLLYLTPNQINDHCLPLVNPIVTQSLALNHLDHLSSIYQTLTETRTLSTSTSTPSATNTITGDDHSRLNAIGKRFETSEPLSLALDWAEAAFKLASQLNLDLPHQLVEWFDEQHHQPTPVAPTHTIDPSEPLESEQPTSTIGATEATDSNLELKQMFVAQQQSLTTLTDAISQLVMSLSHQPVSLPQPQPPRKTPPHPITETSQRSQTSTQPSDSSIATRTSVRTTKAKAKINRAIDAIIDHNNHQASNKNDKWRVSIAALKQLTKCGQNVISRVVQERHDELEQHHQLHQLGQYHNSKGPHTSITDFISFDEPSS